MGVILKRIRLVGSKGEKKVEGLFDSGASFSFIQRELAETLDLIIALPTPLEFETAKNGDKIRVTEAVRLDFYIEGIRLSDEFMIAPELSEKLIIGAKTMQKWRLKLDFEHDQVMVDQTVTRLMLK
jgi:predicted aspartyl protease